ncbi:MAG: hypothetical protein ACHQD8_04410 [Chitinophagales bacterium]
MVYDLSLEEVKVKPHQVTTLHLLSALAFIGTGAIIFIYNYVITMWGATLLAVGVVLLALTILKNSWVTSKHTNTPIRIIELAIALAIGIYSATQHWKFPVTIFGILSASLLFGIYWERASGNALSVHIDETGLKIPVISRQRFLKWTEVEEVVLRFGTLTVNCVDNRFYQWNIADTGIDNAAFEAYCNTQVEANRSKRRNDDW